MSSRNPHRKSEVAQDQIYKLAGVTSPEKVAQKDLCGSLIMKAAFRECINLCDGFVILVSTLGWCDSDISSNLWVKHGVIVDLSSNPVDWDEHYKTRSQQDTGEIVQIHDYKVRTITGCLDSLSSLLSAIQQAVTIIEDLRSKEKLTKPENENSSSLHNITPIPIIFDSISLLIRIHGPRNIVSFLDKLKHIGVNNSAYNKNTMASPIFIPVLNEVLPQSIHRSIEDLADATMTVKSGQLLIARRSARGGGGMLSPSLGPCGRKLVKDIQQFEIGHEGTLQWNVSENNYEHVIQSTFTASKSKLMNLGSSDSNATSSLTGRIDKLMLQSDDGPRPSVSSNLPLDTKPRIFFETDDPEFLDIDDEDPDDDLDL